MGSAAAGPGATTAARPMAKAMAVRRIMIPSRTFSCEQVTHSQYVTIRSTRHLLDSHSTRHGDYCPYYCFGIASRPARRTKNAHGGRLSEALEKRIRAYRPGWLSVSGYRRRDSLGPILPYGAARRHAGADQPGIEGRHRRRGQCRGGANGKGLGRAWQVQTGLHHLRWITNGCRAWPRLRKSHR